MQTLTKLHSFYCLCFINFICYSFNIIIKKGYLFNNIIIDVPKNTKLHINKKKESIINDVMNGQSFERFTNQMI